MAFLQEAKELWEIGKALRLSFTGDEEDLIDMLDDVEIRDRAAYGMALRRGWGLSIGCFCFGDDIFGSFLFFVFFF